MQRERPCRAQRRLVRARERSSTARGGRRGPRPAPLGLAQLAEHTRQSPAGGRSRRARHRYSRPRLGAPRRRTRPPPARRSRTTSASPDGLSREQVRREHVGASPPRAAARPRARATAALDDHHVLAHARPHHRLRERQRARGPRKPAATSPSAAGLPRPPHPPGWPVLQLGVAVEHRDRARDCFASGGSRPSRNEHRGVSPRELRRSNSFGRHAGQESSTRNGCRRSPARLPRRSPAPRPRPARA